MLSSNETNAKDRSPLTYPYRITGYRPQFSKTKYNPDIYIAPRTIVGPIEVSGRSDGDKCQTSQDPIPVGTVKFDRDNLPVVMNDRVKLVHGGRCFHILLDDGVKGQVRIVYHDLSQSGESFLCAVD